MAFLVMKINGIEEDTERTFAMFDIRHIDIRLMQEG